VGDWISDVMISQLDTVKNRITLCLFDPNERHHVDGESNNLERDIIFEAADHQALCLLGGFRVGK